MNVKYARALEVMAPHRWRLPGDMTDKKGRWEIQGKARRSIAHALTYHGIPGRIDKFLHKLPSERSLKRLSSTKKAYLSFTVYSLKQMVAAGTVSPATAWGLFFREMEKIPNLDEIYVAEQKDAFFYNLQRDGLFDGQQKRMGLLQFEFFARAGEEGLRQFERFEEWSTELVFCGKEYLKLHPGIMLEYAKALWLEMRDIEGRSGITGLNLDVKKFTLQRKAEYNPGERNVLGNVDLFNRLRSAQSGESIDSTMLAEIGHWHFDPFNRMSGWASELMDRMNMSRFTSRGINGLSSFDGVKYLSPEAATFLYGGYYLQAREEVYGHRDIGFPVYPEEFPSSRLDSTQKHEVAEFIERMIRLRIIRAVEDHQLKMEDMFKMYWRTGVYVSLLHLEGLHIQEINMRLQRFNIREINKYYKHHIKKALQAWRNILLYSGEEERRKAAVNLGKLGGKEVFSDLERAVLEDKDIYVRGRAAASILNMFHLKDQFVVKGLQAYRIVMGVEEATEEEWASLRKELISCGRAAVPALEAALGHNKVVNARLRHLIRKIRAVKRKR